MISLSDCMTPWELIEKRLLAAAEADLVICLYNPSSRRRAGYLKKACEIVEKAQSPDTVCGYVKNIGRDGQETGVLSLKELAEFEADMFTTVYIGNSRTKGDWRENGNTERVSGTMSMKKIVLVCRND